MNGATELISVIDYVFNLMSQIWTTLVLQNIFLFITAILSLVVLVIKIKNATTK